MRFLLVLFPIFIALSAKAGPSERPGSAKDSLLRSFLKEARKSERAYVQRSVRDSTDELDTTQTRPKRGVAIALTILLGPLGGHRLYLGTEPHVPVLYTVTLGGGLGLLPLIDLVQLIVAEDMESFLNNRRVFMWLRGDDDEEEGSEKVE